MRNRGDAYINVTPKVTIQTIPKRKTYKPRNPFIYEGYEVSTTSATEQKSRQILSQI